MTSKKATAPAAAPEAPKILPSKVWPLDRIREYPHNPRTHPPAQVTLLAELLKRYGPDQDIVVDEDGVILKGHGRKLAATLAGMKRFPVTQRVGLPEDDKRAMRIADNQVALLSGWDSQLVGFEIEALKRSNYDVALLGFGDAQLVSFTTKPGPPGEFQEYGADIPTHFCCPNCRYSWSGDPQAGKVKDGKPGGGDADSVQVRVPRKPDGKGRSGKAAAVPAKPPLARKAATGKRKRRKRKPSDRAQPRAPA